MKCKKPNNVLHIVTNLSDGGLEKVVYMIVANSLRYDLNHFVVVLTKCSNNFLISKFEELKVKVIEMDFVNRIHGLGSVLKNMIQLVYLSEIMKKFRIDVVHSHDFFPAFVARLSVLICKFILFYRVRRVYITLHNIFFWLGPIHQHINKLLSIVTDKIICVSNSVYNYSLVHDKIKKEKYEIIHNGVEIANYTPDINDNKKYREELGFEIDDLIIGNIGVLSVRKGQKYIIKALPEIIKRFPTVKLLIFGSTREHEIGISNEIMNIISENELKERVFIFNPRHDINKIFNIFDVFVMASISEGLSLSAIEAMLMEKICLFSDIEPFKEIVTEGETGFLFESQNVDSLSDRLVFIIKNLERLRSVGKTARSIALEKFDVKRMVAEYIKLYFL